MDSQIDRPIDESLGRWIDNDGQIDGQTHRWPVANRKRNTKGDRRMGNG